MLKKTAAHVYPGHVEHYFFFATLDYILSRDQSLELIRWKRSLHKQCFFPRPPRAKTLPIEMLSSSASYLHFQQRRKNNPITGISRVQQIEPWKNHREKKIDIKALEIVLERTIYHCESHRVYLQFKNRSLSLARIRGFPRARRRRYVTEMLFFSN